jgi:hypothetical protein
MVTALRATSRTIADFLQARFESDADLSALFGGGGTMRVYLNTPAEMSGARLGLSVWLYRMVRDDSTLNRPPQRITPELTLPVLLPVKLHFLFTPVTNSNTDDSLETEQVILGKILQSFHARPQLAGVDLRDDFQGTAAVVTVRLEMLSLDEFSLIWDALDTSYRASLSYEVTVVDIEPDRPPQRAEPVRVPLPQPAIVVGGTN